MMVIAIVVLVIIKGVLTMVFIQMMSLAAHAKACVLR